MQNKIVEIKLFDFLTLQFVVMAPNYQIDIFNNQHNKNEDAMKVLLLNFLTIELQ